MNNIENDGIQLFEDQNIRVAWDEQQEEWSFSVVDVVAVLTEQTEARKASTYWAVLKKRLKEEGADELLTNCKQLKMKSPKDGKRYKTDVANTEQPQGFDENQKVARRGGNVAGVARKALEAETGRTVVTSQNAESFRQLVTDLVTEAAELPEKVENTGGNDNGK